METQLTPIALSVDPLRRMFRWDEGTNDWREIELVLPDGDGPSPTPWRQLAKFAGKAVAIHSANGTPIVEVWGDAKHSDVATAALIVRAVNRDAHVAPLMEAVTSLLAVVDESQGITGWHLNGADAAWSEFDFIDDLRAALAAAQQAAS